MWLTYDDKQKGKKVKCGQVVAGVYYKIVPKSNVLKLNDSIGIQREILDDLTGMGVETIKCKIEGRGIFQSKTSDWLQPGVWQQEWKQHGQQRFLPIKSMEKL
jgi:hypothetical protein